MPGIVKRLEIFFWLLDFAFWHYNVTAIDTAADITITVAATTETYMVKQNICGNVKYDTVVVNASGVGINELKNDSGKLKIYPQPVNDDLTIEIEKIPIEEKFELKIFNNLNQIVREENIIFKDKIIIKANDLTNGICFLRLKNDSHGNMGARFIISR